MSGQQHRNTQLSDRLKRGLWLYDQGLLTIQCQRLGRRVVSDGRDDFRDGAPDVGYARRGVGLVDDVGGQQEELGDHHGGDRHDDHDDDGGGAHLGLGPLRVALLRHF